MAVSLPAFANDTGRDQNRFEQVAYGISLYEEHCANCHQGFAETTKPQRSVERLRSSIEHFPVMNSLDFLNPQQLDAIAEALNTVPLKEAALSK
jgi:mono/diheme cytochrome c family protein